MLKSQASQYALIFLAVCAAFVALKLAEQVFAPIVLGLVIGVVLAPFSDLLERMRLPQSRPRSQDTALVRALKVGHLEIAAFWTAILLRLAHGPPITTSCSS